MNAPFEPAERGLPRRVMIGVAAVLAGLLLFLLLPARKAESPRTSDNGSQATKSGTDRDCELRLEGILAGLDPERVVISSSRVDRLGELSQWASDCGSSRLLSDVTVDLKANEAWLTGETLARAGSASYSQRDMHHLTTARLLGQVASGVLQRESDPLEQALDLWDYVVRQTLLEPDDSAVTRPRTPLEALLVGRATAADRAWTFAELLRQLRLDAVIVQPSGNAVRNVWLIGVVRPEGGLWLFEPRIGVPIPAPGFKPAGLDIPLPATLAEVRAQPELLRQLDTEEHPYPLQGPEFERVAIRIIGDSTIFSERMARLQNSLSGGLIEVFDGLGASSLREPGLGDRIVAAGSGGGWTREDVSVWEYPEQQQAAFIETGAESSPAWQTITEAFLGPTIFSTVKGQDDQSIPVVERTRDPLRRVRLVHLSGRYADALPLYLRIRTAARVPAVLPTDPALMQRLQQAMPGNNLVADFACYWTALCQYEQGRSDLTLQMLRQYVRDFPIGNCRDAVPELLAFALVKTDRMAEALPILEQIPPRTRSQRAAYLRKLLKSQVAGAPPSESVDAPSTTGADPASMPDEAPIASEAPVDNGETPAPAESEASPAADETPAEPATPSDESEPPADAEPATTAEPATVD
ncbi:MAG: hypothetical protein KF774_19735 [Planctomyces sp.]|nr:hypothetical protein [Planctomyces sp.]